MCGICGFVAKKNISLQYLKQMNDIMIHRGPDDSGAEIFNDNSGYYVGMAQRRLSILDLSLQGHQPMHAYDDSVILVFNGEVYNYHDLKNKTKDYPYVSKCDTETIIGTYLKWGRISLNKWIEKIDGMFAFALYDKKIQTLYLVRDRIGKKPLYYWIDGYDIVFSSELKSIMVHPYFKKNINKKVIPRYLFQQYINAPDTIFDDVYQLEPGCILSYKIGGEINIQKYWDIYSEYKIGIQEMVSDYSEAKYILKKILKNAVSKRMIADVPLGTFLSGGYDSSLITALAQECSNTPINTFSIGVYDDNLDEAKYARKISEYLGTRHTEMYLDDKILFDMIEDIPKYFDQPFADSSQIPTMLVSKIAKEKITVALSGDGGDELFCGYSIYDQIRLAQKFDRIGGLLYFVGKLGIRNYRINELYPIQIKAVTENRDKRFKTQVGANGYQSVIHKMMKSESNYYEQKYDMEIDYIENNWQIKRMLLDMYTYLPGDILTKVDRSSMRYSLECRCPMLDTEVIRYSFRMSHYFKYNHGDKKHILKDIAYDYIPKEILERPKQGFSIPINNWLTGGLRHKVEEYADESFLKEQGIFEPQFVHKLIKQYLNVGDRGPATGNNYSRIVWPFFIFQQWYEYYVH